MIPLSEIVGLKQYDGAALDGDYPPHCFEIQTRMLIFYVGENLDCYKKKEQEEKRAEGVAVKLPRRESGVGMLSALKWYEALGKALLPPEGPRQPSNAEIALEFSQIYQVSMRFDMLLSFRSRLKEVVLELKKLPHIFKR